MSCDSLMLDAAGIGSSVLSAFLPDPVTYFVTAGERGERRRARVRARAGERDDQIQFSPFGSPSKS